MINAPWLERLQSLSVRFACLGVSADLAGLTLIELWGAYRYLSRLTDA